MLSHEVHCLLAAGPFRAHQDVVILVPGLAERTDARLPVRAAADVTASVQQPPNDFRPAFTGCDVQRRHAAGALRVRIRARAEQAVNHRGMALARRAVQRCEAIKVAWVDRGPHCKQ